MRWLILVLFSGFAAVAGAEEQAARLTVQGKGVIDVAPDMATIRMGVTAEAKTASEAMDRVSASTAEVLETLFKAGLEKRDVQTSDLSLHPLWSNRNSSKSGPPRIEGYQARNSVTVRSRDLAALGNILDAVIESGANEFNGLSFGLQNPEPLMDKARALAVADARWRAETYANAAGVLLGPIIEIIEGGGGAPRPMAMERMAMMADSVPIAAGEVGISANVTIVYALIQN